MNLMRTSLTPLLIMLVVSVSLSQTAWYDDPQNPHLRNYGRVLEPSVIYNSAHDIFELWASDGYRVLRALSLDGRDWYSYEYSSTQDIAFEFGMSFLYGVNVIQVDSLYFMYVTNYRSDGCFDIGLMTSQDGSRWVKHPASPVISVGAPGSWNPTGAVYPRVVKRGEVFYMVYNAGDSVHGYIGMATSSDGIQWEAYSGNPVITYGEPGAVDELAVGAMGMTVVDGEFRMVVRAVNVQNETREFIYRSVDGFQWSKLSSEPFLAPGDPGTWNDGKLSGGTLLFLNGKYHYWYCAQGKYQYGWSFGYMATDSTLVTRESVTGVEISDAPMPSECALEQNWPNPFNPTTVIGYTVGEGVRGRLGEGGKDVGTVGRGELGRNVLVQLTVYDMLGREVAVLVNEEQRPGHYQVRFDGTQLASGTYIYRLRSGDFVTAKRLVLLR